ncbi:MAG: NTP transferase domain-containing protein [Erythrobacter sp.]|nr:NTP transferase domain-containing protein [Erythrobacter sp.]
MRNLVTPIILCGGGGTRLWPRSRTTQPKPFLPLMGETTLFRQALARAQDGSIFAAPMIVTGRAHFHFVESQKGEGETAIILEPSARNTAAAIALAAHRLPYDGVMLVCPSDHHIADAAAFVAAAERSAVLAREGWLVAFGIHADRPETGFGYIRRGAAVSVGRSELGFRIDHFVEKPDRSRAQAFLNEGGYDWNGGIFAFTAGRFLEELAVHRPDIATAVALAVEKGDQDGNWFAPDAELFAAVPSESIDYAVMEKTDRAAVVPVDMGWSDIGNWHVLRDARAGDADGNRVTGRAELVDCRNVLVESDGPRVSVIGLEDVCIVVDGDEVLVTTVGGAQKVGKLAGAQNQDGAA